MKLLNRLTILLNLILLALPSYSFAENTVIRNISISSSSIYLNARFQLAHSFNKKMEEAIKTGIPTTFNYYINLYQIRPLWKDTLLTSFTLSKTIKYDALKKEYLVTEKTSAGNNIRSSDTPTLYEAKKIMNNVDVLSLYPIWKLDRSKSYYIKIKADSEGIDPPSYINYLLFFLNRMNFETDWFVESFTY